MTVRRSAHCDPVDGEATEKKQGRWLEGKVPHINLSTTTSLGKYEILQQKEFARKKKKTVTTLARTVTDCGPRARQNGAKLTCRTSKTHTAENVNKTLHCEKSYEKRSLRGHSNSPNMVTDRNGGNP